MTHPSRKNYANEYKRKEYTGGASEKMKSEVAEATKKKRDKLQARHVSPGGGGKYKPGPHKVDVHRRDLKPLIKWLPEKAQEKTLKFADKMDKKLETHYKKKRTKKKMQARAKKLEAYKGYT